MSSMSSSLICFILQHSGCTARDAGGGMLSVTCVCQRADGRVDYFHHELIAADWQSVRDWLGY